MTRAIAYLFFPIFLLLTGCATVTTHTEGDDRYQKEKAENAGFAFPTYSGPKIRIQIIRFGIPEEISAKYPELASKRVGWGLCNRLAESFWSTNMFEFVEEKDEVVQKLADQWKLSESGIVSEDTAVEAGSLRAPQYLVYAEVYDFGVSHSEEVTGLQVKERNTTVIGIQLRMVDVKTGEYIPASAEGQCGTIGVGAWASVNLEFDQTTVGKASQDAIDTAVVKLMKRFLNKE
jgi:curli biogenesis system outer membrane secretion channel CsgG